MKVSWHSFNLRTGVRGPRIVTEKLGTVSRVIGEATQTELSVSCWDLANNRPRAGWAEATLPGRNMLVAIDEDDSDRIIWGGIIVMRRRSQSAWVPVTVMSLEHYLDRLYVAGCYFGGVDQATIAATVVGQINTSDGINLTIDAQPTGVSQYSTWLETDDKTILSVLSEFEALDKGLEYTINLGWADGSHTKLTRTIVIRKRIGQTYSTPPEFRYPGAITSFEFAEDYTTGNGGNDVLATSSGQGIVRPESSHHVAQDLLDAGWARFETRVSPATSIVGDNTTNVTTLVDKGILESFATRELAVIRDGVQSLSFATRLEVGPRLGVDWQLGDTVSVIIAAPSLPEVTGPDGGLMPGMVTQMRVMGWTIDLDARTLVPTCRGTDVVPK